MAAHAAPALSRATEVESTLAPAEQGPLPDVPLASSLTSDWGLALGISTADFAARAFSGDPASLQTVRRFIRENLSAWGLNALAEDLMIVVNELAANAVQHALAGPGEADSKAWLGVARTGSTVVCSVTDPSPTPPTRADPTPLADAGRGLLIVDALTSQWGYATTAPGGKTVWARIADPSH
ncbi:ATP-binding protein [Streptomyces cyaneochromogenes]|uniref:ATP-binding protein n=1 Tax=Streptomyces cyaneochromogenes TaxID=2496836 RepID=A0A3Q9EW40_9ACTN|nr:ATP-binding protein [Streptomyces cyaneochromogenes]AZQ32121.1 ATP-binding protein [Streptomyces cyaneochromogenes]AZQ40102.1 ATP-binding protein [Streptomyces cyaneochromogenes]